MADPPTVTTRTVELRLPAPRRPAARGYGSPLDDYHERRRLPLDYEAGELWQE